MRLCGAPNRGMGVQEHYRLRRAFVCAKRAYECFGPNARAPKAPGGAGWRTPRTRRVRLNAPYPKGPAVWRNCFAGNFTQTLSRHSRKSATLEALSAIPYQGIEDTLISATHPSKAVCGSTFSGTFSAHVDRHHARTSCRLRNLPSLPGSGDAAIISHRGWNWLSAAPTRCGIGAPRSRQR
jgi:hypothetical protein